MSVVFAQLGSAFREVDGLGTVVAMGGWCGAYSCLHHGIYALSYVWYPRGRDDSQRNLDAPNPKYWGSSMRRISTARLVALTHAVASWLWSVRVLAKGLESLSPAVAAVKPPNGGGAWFRYDSANQASEVAFMRHSLGYFVQELAHVLIYEPDVVFVSHHLLYLASTFPICALSDKGWPLIAVATALAEATNPLQLSWEMAKAFGRTDLYDALSLPFTLSFFLCRGVLMPLFMADMARFLFGGHKEHQSGDFVLRSTFFLFFGGLAASVVWLSNLVRGFLRYRAKKRKQR
mmetsp:Transcript_29378/g.94769  ORF Transcript_29378/g.94769 Transcript_29378/m.94769 type:complete len:290 (-) Transcript_29378:264-1133(-)|eukprot:CAMPEP_0118915138 /NCGR_PEP_ID=MMETSP1166-20130328/15369_1 /TAXON_ID=1104430 /ORGANISM="Chrysoreinhardia sp, Strain CCMP3193" /LENGTH=289 /DNA_ID=CAMNT_0006854799 /DNA_START=35 /DNA_END=904 /DNA_ORIENTATION=-